MFYVKREKRNVRRRARGGRRPGLSSDALRPRGGREAPCSGQHCPLPAAAASPRSVPAGGAAPAYRPQIAVRRYPAGIKARPERPQTGRALLARSEPKTERRRAVPVPSEQQGSGRPGGGYLSLRLSLIPTRAPSRPPCVSASCSRVSHRPPAPSRTLALPCTKDTRKPPIRFQLKPPGRSLTLCPRPPGPPRRPGGCEEEGSFMTWGALGVYM